MQTASISNAIANAASATLSGAGMAGGDLAGNDLLSPSGAAAGQTPFAGLLKSAIGNVQSLEDQAASATEGLMTGQGVDVHQAMIATQKADMSFEMALAVRSKAVAAYQQVMQMQF
ncbi:MAG: flagellar hook-basal body complex protein FliE [Silvibacterium sp.]